MNLNIGDIVFFNYYDDFYGLARIIKKHTVYDDEYLIELPKKFLGHGHNGDGSFTEANYWWINPAHIECKVVGNKIVRWQYEI